MTTKSLKNIQNTHARWAADLASQSQAQYLTLALGGTWNGHHGVCYCPAHDDHNNPSLSVADGDTGALLAKCFAGCTFNAVIITLTELELSGAAQHRAIMIQPICKVTLHNDRPAEKNAGAAQ